MNHTCGEPASYAPQVRLRTSPEARSCPQEFHEHGIPGLRQLHQQASQAGAEPQAGADEQLWVSV